MSEEGRATTDIVRIDRDGAVATIAIARPDVRNAMNVEVFEGLWEAGRTVGADRSVRAVVVTGDGPAFSSGLDVTLFASAGEFDPLVLDIARLQRAFTIFEEIPQPVVAAVHGPAFGAGIQLAAACDLRVAAEDAQLSVLETRWGIIPDLGGTQRIPRIIGLGRTKELAYTGRRIGADEAFAWGLVNRVVPGGADVKEAQEWARELAGQPPLALEAIKRLTQQSFDAPIPEGLQREAMVQRRMMASHDFMEAISARFEKREPRFEAR